MVTVDENYDMKLVSVYYRYYATPEHRYIKYNAEINVDTVTNTITAKLDIGSVDIQHYGLYACYVRSLPANLYIDPNDYFYETSRNTTLNITISSPGNCMCHSIGFRVTTFLVGVAVTIVTCLTQELYHIKLWL